MSPRSILLGSVALLAGHLAFAQMTLPKSVEAGKDFSIQLGEAAKARSTSYRRSRC